MDNRLRFYRIKEWYTDKLRIINPHITVNSKNHINTYLGILLEIDGTKFLAPLTHETRQNKFHQQAIITRREDGTTKNKLGTVLIHNMIPVYDNEDDPIYELVDLELLKNGSDADKKKYAMYSEQLQWINIEENRMGIKNKAQLTYDTHYDPKNKNNWYLNNKLHCNIDELKQEMNKMESKVIEQRSV